MVLTITIITITMLTLPSIVKLHLQFATKYFKVPIHSQLATNSHVTMSTYQLMALHQQTLPQTTATIGHRFIHYLTFHSTNLTIPSKPSYQKTKEYRTGQYP